MDFFAILQSIIAVGVIVALGISVWTIGSLRRQNNYQSLIEVFKLMNTFEEREARKRIHDAFKLYMEYHYRKGFKISGRMYWAKNLPRYKGEAFLDIFRDPDVLDHLNLNEFELQQDVERVRDTFDQIGALFQGSLIPKDALLRVLWSTGRVYWICLAQNIFIERDKRGTESYMDNFESLFKEIEKYRNRQRPILEPVQP